MAAGHLATIRHSRHPSSNRSIPCQSLPETHLKVKVQPRASANKIAGFRDGVLLVRVTAPPEKGRANAAVIALLADALGVAKTSVHITRGITPVRNWWWWIA